MKNSLLNGMRRNRVFLLVFLFLYLCCTIIAGGGLLFNTSAGEENSSNTAVGSYEAEGGRYEMYIYNFSPDKMTADASDLFGNNPDKFNPYYAHPEYWEDVTFGKSKTHKLSRTSKGSYVNAANIINIDFDNVADGYVPMTVLADKDWLDRLVNSAEPDFEKWLWSYMQHLTGKGENYVEAYAEPQQWSMDGDGDYTGLSFVGNKTIMTTHDNSGNALYSESQSPLPRAYDSRTNPEGKPLYMVVGAVPCQNEAITVSVNSPAQVKLSNDVFYEKNWKVDITVTNNASYPVYIMSDLEDAYFEEDSGLDSDYSLVKGTYFGTKYLPSNSRHTFSVELYTNYYYPGGVDMDNYKLNATSTAVLPIRVSNVTHSMGGNIPEAYSDTYHAARTVYPGDADALDLADSSNIKAMQKDYRSTPLSVSPAMIGISASAFSGYVDVTITGRNMDRVKRVAIKLTSGSEESALGSTLKNRLAMDPNNVFKDLPNREEVLESIAYARRIFIFAKSQGDMGQVDSTSLGKDYYSNWVSRTSTTLTFRIYSKHLPKDFKNAAYADTCETSTTNVDAYFDVFLFHSDESYPLSYDAIYGENPSRKRGPDAKIVVSAKAKSGSANIADSSKISGSGISIVPTNFVSGVPTGPQLKVVTGALTYGEGQYAALKLVGDGEITKSYDVAIGNTWTMAAPLKINQYLEVRGKAGVDNPVVIVKQKGNTIWLESVGCELYGGSTKLMGDFSSVLTETSKKWWVSDWRAEENLCRNGPKISNELINKVKLIAKQGQNSAFFNIGVVKGGITHVYPYIWEAGVGVLATTFDFIPDILNDFGLSDYAKAGVQIDEFRIPHEDFSEMPAIKLSEPLSLNLGGNFYFFEAGVELSFDIEMLPENMMDGATRRNYVSISGEANLFNKLQVEAELLFKMYNGELIPDVLYFAAGSDMIGLLPPLPIIELSQIGAGIQDIGATFGDHGGNWQYIPPINIILTANAEINLYALGIGVNKASITVGPSIFEMGFEELVIKKIKLMEDVKVGLKWDLSKGVEIVEGFNLSMPIIEYSMSGGINISVEDTPLQNFIVGSGEFKFKVYGDRLLEGVLRLVRNAGTNAGTGKNLIDGFKTWISENENKSEKDYLGLTKLIRASAEFVHVDIMSYFINAFEITGSARGLIKIPNGVPGIGGKTIAKGNASFSIINSVLKINAAGRIDALNISGGISISIDANTGSYGVSLLDGDDADRLTEMNSSVYYFDSSGAALATPPTALVQSMQLADMVSNNALKSSPSVQIAPMSVVGGSNGNHTLTVTDEDLDKQVLLEIFATAPAAVTLIHSGGKQAVNITAYEYDLQDVSKAGWIKLGDNQYSYTHVFFGESDLGAAGGIWTVSGSGITGIDFVYLPYLEEIKVTSFDKDSGELLFALSNAASGASYAAEIRIATAEEIDKGGMGVCVSDPTDLIDVTANGTTTYTLSSGALDRFPDGRYYILIAVYRTVDGRTTMLANPGQSDAFDFINGVLPDIGGITAEYKGNGVTQVDVTYADPTDKDKVDGYIVSLHDDSDNEIKIEYSGEYEGNKPDDTTPFEGMTFAVGRAIRFAVSGTLPAGGYIVHIAPYTYVGDTQLTGKSYSFNLTISAASPITVDVFGDAEGVIKKLGEGAYVAAAREDIAVDADGNITATTVKKEITFSLSGVLNGATYSIAVSKDGEELSELSVTDGVLSEWSKKLILALSEGVYDITITTKTANNDIFVFIAALEIDGTLPTFIVNSDSMSYDGVNLYVEGFIEAGSTFVRAGGATYNDADDITGVEYLTAKKSNPKDNDILTGAFKWYGAVSAVVEPVSQEYKDNFVDVTYYYIYLYATDKAGNISTVRLVFMLEEGLEPTAVRFQLDAPMGTTLSPNMTGAYVTAALTTAFGTDAPLDISKVSFASSNQAIIKVNADGSLDILSLGIAKITATYTVGGEPQTAFLEFEVIESVPLVITIESYLEDSIVFSVGMLFTDKVDVYVSIAGGEYTKILTLDSGFDGKQTFAAENLPEYSACSFKFVTDGNIYRETVVYAVTGGEDDLGYGVHEEEVVDPPVVDPPVVDPPVTPDNPPPEGLSVGAIVGIAAGSVAAAALGGFALFWFVIKKRSMAELLAVFKKK